jgi:hypothetical protein
MDIVPWPRSLGLGKYEAAFRENEITENVLPNLTAEDLKELGVAALRHRRTLLDAITGPSAAAAATRFAPSVSPEDRFSDLVGSTALSARMDPEDLREVISPTRSEASSLRCLGSKRYLVARRESLGATRGADCRLA